MDPLSTKTNAYAGRKHDLEDPKPSQGSTKASLSFLTNDQSLSPTGLSPDTHSTRRVQEISLLVIQQPKKNKTKPQTKKSKTI